MVRATIHPGVLDPVVPDAQLGLSEFKVWREDLLLHASLDRIHVGNQVISESNAIYGQGAPDEVSLKDTIVGRRNRWRSDHDWQIVQVRGNRCESFPPSHEDLSLGSRPAAQEWVEVREVVGACR